jgi:prepilin-type processing-associated H-X9-DG protein
MIEVMDWGRNWHYVHPGCDFKTGKIRHKKYYNVVFVDGHVAPKSTHAFSIHIASGDWNGLNNGY